MPYKTVERLHPELQSQNLLDADLARFDALRPVITSQFNEVTDPANLEDWLDYYRALVEKQQISLHHFIELVVNHVEQESAPKLEPAD